MIKPKGRPATQCAHCRESRKTKQIHSGCTCSAGPHGKQHLPSCPCYVNKELCTCAKNKSTSKRTSSNPPPAAVAAAAAAAAVVASTSSSTTVHSTSPGPKSGPSRSSSSTSLTSSIGKGQQRKSSIMTSHGAIIHPSSSASLSTQLSLMNNNNSLEESGPDFEYSNRNNQASNPLQGYFVRTDHSADQPNFLDTSSSHAYKKPQLLYSSNSVPCVPWLTIDQPGTSGSTYSARSLGFSGESCPSSLGAFMASPSNADGYVSDVEPPLQFNYPHYQPAPSDFMRTASATTNNGGHNKALITMPILSDFEIMNQSEHQNDSALGLLNQTTQTSGFDRAHVWATTDSSHLVQPLSTALPEPDFDLFQASELDGQIFNTHTSGQVDPSTRFKDSNYISQQFPDFQPTHSSMSSSSSLASSTTTSPCSISDKTVTTACTTRAKQDPFMSHQTLVPNSTVDMQAKDIFSFPFEADFPNSLYMISPPSLASSVSPQQQ